MCGLPKMPFRAGETFPRRERRDLVLPRESSTKIIEMVQCDRNRPFGPHPANPYGSSLSLLFANSARVALQTTTFRSEEHTSELQSLMRISYAVLCLQKKNK